MTPRKPNEEHVANCTFRKDRHGSPVTARAIDLVTELPSAPDHFCEYAVEHWSALGNELVREKKLTRSELHFLASACMLYARIRDLKAVEMRRREALGGLFVDDRETLSAIKECRMTLPAYNKTLVGLGLGAVARSQAMQSVAVALTGGPKRKPAFRR